MSQTLIDQYHHESSIAENWTIWATFLCRFHMSSHRRDEMTRETSRPLLWLLVVTVDAARDFL